LLLLVLLWLAMCKTFVVYIDRNQGPEIFADLSLKKCLIFFLLALLLILCFLSRDKEPILIELVIYGLMKRSDSLNTKSALFFGVWKRLWGWGSRVWVEGRLQSCLTNRDRFQLENGARKVS
jgi:hypothetical protein